MKGGARTGRAPQGALTLGEHCASEAVGVRGHGRGQGSVNKSRQGLTNVRLAQGRQRLGSAVPLPLDVCVGAR